MLISAAGDVELVSLREVEIEQEVKLECVPNMGNES